MTINLDRQIKQTIIFKSSYELKEFGLKDKSDQVLL